MAANYVEAEKFSNVCMQTFLPREGRYCTPSNQDRFVIHESLKSRHRVSVCRGPIDVFAYDFGVTALPS